MTPKNLRKLLVSLGSSGKFVGIGPFSLTWEEWNKPEPPSRYLVFRCVYCDYTVAGNNSTPELKLREALGGVLWFTEYEGIDRHPIVGICRKCRSWACRKCSRRLSTRVFQPLRIGSLLTTGLCEVCSGPVLTSLEPTTSFRIKDLREIATRAASLLGGQK